MLYQLYETQRALMAPFSEFASASAKLYTHPLSAFSHTPMAQRVSAGLDLMHRLAKEYEKPEFVIRGATVDGVEVAVQEQVAVTKPFCRLLRFKRFTDNPAVLDKMKTQPTVLVVAPLSGHHSTLLRDTVRVLLRDHKVLITDWTDAPVGTVVSPVRGGFNVSEADAVSVVLTMGPTGPYVATAFCGSSRVMTAHVVRNAHLLKEYP